MKSPDPLLPARHASYGAPIMPATYFQAVGAEGGLAAAEQAQAAGDPGILPDHVETLRKQLANWNRHTVLASLPW